MAVKTNKKREVAKKLSDSITYNNQTSDISLINIAVTLEIKL